MLVEKKKIARNIRDEYPQCSAYWVQEIKKKLLVLQKSHPLCSCAHIYTNPFFNEISGLVLVTFCVTRMNAFADAQMLFFSLCGIYLMFLRPLFVLFVPFLITFSQYHLNYTQFIIKSTTTMCITAIAIRAKWNWKR